MGRTIHMLGLVLALLVLAGCPQNPATMNQAEVEAYLKENISLKEVAMTPNPAGGGFTGTGKGSDGSNYKITVTQDLKEGKLSYSAESDSGDTRSGFKQVK